MVLPYKAQQRSYKSKAVPGIQSFQKQGFTFIDLPVEYLMHALISQANSNAENIKLISAMLCAALYPNVVQVKECFFIFPSAV